MITQGTQPGKTIIDPALAKMAQESEGAAKELVLLYAEYLSEVVQVQQLVKVDEYQSPEFSRLPLNLDLVTQTLTHALECMNVPKFIAPKITSIPQPHLTKFCLTEIMPLATWSQYQLAVE